MTVSLTASLLLKFNATQTSSSALSSPADTPVIQQTTSYTDGTGANKAQKLYYAQRTLAATTETLDLTSGLTDVWGNALNFTTPGVKGVMVINTDTTSGHLLKIGGAAANAWVGAAGAGQGPFVDPTDIGVCGAGGKWCAESPVDAFTVSATSKNLKIDAGANTVIYDLVIWG